MSDTVPADALAVLSITVSLRPPRAPGQAFQDAVVDVRVETNHRSEDLETELHVAGDDQDARGLGMADAVLDALRMSMRRWADFAEVRWVAANRGRARASKDEVLKKRERSWQRYLEIRKALRAGVADQDMLVSEAMGIAGRWDFEPPHDELAAYVARGAQRDV